MNRIRMDWVWMVAVLPEQLGGVEVVFRIGKGSTESRPTIPGVGLCLHRGGK